MAKIHFYDFGFTEQTMHGNAKEKAFFLCISHVFL